MSKAGRVSSLKTDGAVTAEKGSCTVVVAVRIDSGWVNIFAICITWSGRSIFSAVHLQAAADHKGFFKADGVNVQLIAAINALLKAKESQCRSIRVQTNSHYFQVVEINACTWLHSVRNWPTAMGTSKRVSVLICTKKVQNFNSLEPT